MTLAAAATNLLSGTLPWPLPAGVIWRAAPRPLADPLGFASRADFLLSAPHLAGRLTAQAQAIPYVYLPRRRSLLYTLHDDPAPVLDALFLFRAQREAARHVLEIRLADLAHRSAGWPEPAPLFLLSPGRAGSTLVGRLARAAGHTALLEPDLYTGLARARPARAATRTLIRAGTAALCGLAGTPSPLIKLRSQGAALWNALADALPKARFAVLLRRDLAAWARSTHRAFGDTAESLLATQCDAHEAHQGLHGLGRTAAPLFYEDIVVSAEATLARLGLPPRPGTAGAIAVAAAVDSQAGTELDRTTLVPRASEASVVARFSALWSAYSGIFPSPPGRSQI